MKKRILALIAALVLCLSLLVSALSATATDTPHFLAVNDNLLQLEDRYIPILADGLYYVPYHALDVYSTGIDLGIYPVYNTVIRTLTIYNREKVISFDLTAGTCTDRDGMLYAVRAVTRNGQIYVPAEFICGFFGLTYSYFASTNYGPMVRICSSSAKLPDRTFLAAAQLMMEDRLNDWRKNQTVTPVVTPTPTPTQTPKPTTSPRPTASADPVVDKSGVRTYLAFRADQTGGLVGLINRLEYYQMEAVFFFPADRLAQCDEEVRRVLCSGNKVGLLLSGTTAEELTASVAEGNRLLRQMVYCNTYTVLLPDGVDREGVQALEDSGLLIWRTDVEVLPGSQSASSQAGTALRQIETYDQRVYILSDCSTSASSIMMWLIPELVDARYDLRLAVETEIWE